MRLGLPREVFAEGVDPEVEARVRGSIDTFRELGAQIVEVSLPHSRYAIATYYLLSTAEASSNLSRFDGVRFGQRAPTVSSLEEMYVKTRQQGFGPEVKRRIMLGTFALSAGYYDAYYKKAQRVRTLIRRDYTEALAQCDLLVLPTAPTAAFTLGEKMDDPLQMYLADIFTIGCNLAGLPGMSLPCGFTVEKLPVGLQLIGPALGEEKLFAAAAAYEAATSWHERRPKLQAAP
jgi:aspartyl-tRNA(Asn)/glutamyl-tRNA(Gln) amidotransferase subunit A